MEARRGFIYKERIIDLEFRISRLGILGRAYYDLAQIKLKRHRAQISIARQQNSLLHAALDTLREKDRIARKNAGHLEKLRKRTASLRIHFDHQRDRVFKRQRKLELQITGTHSAEVECAQVLDPNTPPEVIIRSLEHKIARIQIKIQGVQIVVKQYEATLQPMRDEWIIYDAKLAALQEHVSMKTHECELLINTHHDAIRARDAAKRELEELLASLFAYGKKGLISPELRLKILRAIEEIKTVMDVGSMREMYHEYLVQEKQSAYIQTIYEDMKRTLDLLRDDDYRRTRKKSTIKDPHYASRSIRGSILIVQRQSEMKGSFPLLQILEGTQRLVDRLQQGQFTLPTEQTIAKEVLEKCKNSMVQILQALHRALKRKNKEAVKKAEFEAKEAAHWAREEAEVARKKKAAEDARRKYEERAAAREAQREAEEKEARRLQKIKESQQAADDALGAEDSLTRSGDSSTSLTVVGPTSVSTTPQPTGRIVSGSGNEYMLSSYYQLAKETREEVPAAAPTVIFLPSFQQAPSEEGAAQRLDQKRQEISAAPAVGVVPSDGESASASDGTSGRLTPVTGVDLHETGPTTPSSSVTGRAADLPDMEPVSPSSASEQSAEVILVSPEAVILDRDKVRVSVAQSGSDVKVMLSQDRDKVRVSVAQGEQHVKVMLSGLSSVKAPPSPVQSTTPVESALEPDQPLSVVLTSEGSLAQQVTPGETGGSQGTVDTRVARDVAHLTSELPKTPEGLPEKGVLKTDSGKAIEGPAGSERSAVPRPERGGPPGESLQKLSSELPKPGGTSVDNIAHTEEMKAPSAVVIGGGQASTTRTVQPTTGSGLASPRLAPRESAAVAVAALSLDHGATSPETATARALPNTTVLDSGHERPAAEEQKGEGSPLPSVIQSTVERSAEEGPSTTTPSSDVTSEASSEAPGSPPITVHIPTEEKMPAVSHQFVPVAPAALPGDEQPLRVAPATVGMSSDDHPTRTPAGPESPIPEAISSGAPETKAKSPATESKSGSQILPRRTEALPISPDVEGPKATAAGRSSPGQKEVPGDDKLEQRAQEEVPAEAVLPSSPREVPGGAGTSLPRGKGPSDAESAAHTPRAVEARLPRSSLPRSPSGAPIASGAKIPQIEIVSVEESLPQRPGGEWRSPNMPRSPSGAPVATAPKFPFGESTAPMSDKSILSETSSPSGGSSGTGETPSDTARILLPPLSPGQPALPPDARLPDEKDSAAGAAETSDPQK